MVNLSAGFRTVTAAALLAMAATPLAAAPASAEPQRRSCGVGAAHGGSLEARTLYGSGTRDPDVGCDHILYVWGKYAPGGWGEYTFWGPHGHIHTTYRKQWVQGNSAGFDLVTPAPRVPGQLWCAAFRNDGRVLSQACVTS